MATGSAPAGQEPFWQGSLRRLAMSLEARAVAPDAVPLESVATLEVLLVLAQAAGDRTFAQRIEGALEDAKAMLQRIPPGKTASDPSPLLQAARLVAENQHRDLRYPRASALRNLVSSALSLQRDDLALAAYVAAVFPLSTTGADSELRKSFVDVQRQLGTRAGEELNQEIERWKDTKEHTTLIESGLRAADTFALVDAQTWLYVALHMNAAAFSALDDKANALTYLSYVAAHYLGASEADSQTLVREKESLTVLASALDEMPKLVQALRTDEDGAQGQLPDDRTMYFAELALAAARKFGVALDNRLVHLSPLLLCVELGAEAAQGWTPQLLNLFDELVRTYAAAAASQPDVAPLVAPHVRSLALRVFGRPFDEPLADAPRVELARRTYTLCLLALRTIGDEQLVLLAQTAYADLLLRSGLTNEAAQAIDDLLGRSASDERLLRSNLLPTGGALSLHGFLHDRLCWVYFRRGALAAAWGHAEQALGTCRAAEDRIGQLRARFAMSFLRRASGNLSAALAEITVALHLTREMLAAEERAYKVVPLKVEDARKADTPVEDLLPDMLSHASVQSIVAIRWADDGLGLLRALDCASHPEPPLVSELLRAAPPGDGTDQPEVDFLIAMGQCLQELGDPIRAEEAYSLAVAAAGASSEAVARALYRHATLYLTEHRYFSWFANTPRRSLRFSEPGQTDTKNPARALQLLADAYERLSSDTDPLLRLAILAETLAALKAVPPSPEELDLWVNRAADAFKAHRDWFKSDPRFRERLDDRWVVADLHERLAERAEQLDKAGDSLDSRSDLLGAQRCWDEACRLLETIEAGLDIGKTYAKIANVWRYLGRPGKQRELLEAAITQIARGTVSYGPKSDERAILTPMPKLRPFRDTVTLDGSMALRKLRYASELGAIAAAGATVDSGVHLALIGNYLTSGATDAAQEAIQRLLENVGVDDAKALMERVVLAVHLLNFGDAAQAVALLEETLRIALERLTAMGDLHGTITLDLSRNAVSFRGRDSMPDATRTFGYVVSNAMAFKGLMSVRLSGLYALGKALSQADSKAVAMQRLEECAALCVEHCYHSLNVESHHLMGLLHQGTDDLSALRHLRHARTLLRARKVSEGCLEGRFLGVEVSASLGRFFFERGELPKAMHHDRQAVLAAESVREQLGVQEMQAPMLARLSTIFDRLILASLGTVDRPPAERAERALGHAESAKSRSLLDAVGTRSAPAQPAGFLASSAESKARLRREIDEASEVLKSALEREAPTSPSVRVLHAKLLQLGSQYDDLVVGERIEAARHRFVKVTQPTTVAGALDWLRERSAAHECEVVVLTYFVTESETIAWLLSKGGLRCERIDVTATALARDVHHFRESVRSSFDPREGEDPLFDLLIGPFADDLVGKVVGIAPHGVLHDLPFSALRNRGKYLIETAQLFHVPSISLMVHLDATREERPASLLVLADSDGSLPAARIEATKVASVFPEEKRLVFIGGEATRQAFVEHCAGASMLHFATHGTHNRRFPIFSSLTLADGPMLLSDLEVVLPRAPDLVVLSACESGASQVGSGDERIGLAGAFLRAGSTTVVVNAWEADDETMSITMERFYEAMIRRGRRRGAALHEAVLSLVAEGYGPAFWGGLGLIGNPFARSTPPSRR